MTSKNLFWVRSRENNKRRIWVWIVSILLQLVTYPAVMMIYLSRIQFWHKDGMYANETFYKEALRGAAADAIGFQPRCLYVVLALALLIGMQGFSYLYDRKKVDMYHSMPIPLKSRYAVIYWNGIISYLIPCVLSILAAVLIAATQGALGIDVMIECGYAFLLNLLLFMVVYHTTILSVMLTGNKIITGFLILGLLTIDEVSVQVFNGMKYSFFETADSVFTDLKPRFSPVHDYSANIYELKMETDLANISKMILPLYAKWFVIAIIFGVVAYLCYRKRPVEAAGGAIAFPKVKPFLKVIASVLAGVVVCYFVYDAAYYNAWITVLAVMVGTILCCFAIEVIFEFDIRAMTKHLVSTGISVVITLVVFCIYNFDLFGYDTYIPNVEKVESVAIYTDGIYQDYFREENGYEYIDSSEYYRQNMFLTDVGAVCELARKSQDVQPEEMKDCRSIRVLYRMKSGREVSRMFYVDYADVSNEELLNKLIGNTEYIDGVYQIAKAEKLLENNSLEIHYTNGTIERALPSAEAEKIREAWLTDMEQFDFSFARNNKPCGSIELLFADCYNVWTLPVYDSFSNTVAYLTEKGAYYPVELNPEDIASVTVTKHYSMNEKENVQAGGAGIADVVAVGYSEEAIVTESFTNPEEIAEIVEHIYPTNLDMTWHSADEWEVEYEVTVTFKAGSDYPYQAGYYDYQFISGEVPKFVEEVTAYIPEK